MAQQTLEPPAEAHRKAGRRWLLWVGVALVAGGLGLLAHVGWQLFGTNMVAHREQARIVAQTQRIWAHGAPAPGPAARPAPAREKGVAPAGAEALVRIPRFGGSYVVPVQEGVSAEVLSVGYGHFPGTALPGQVGNYALAAHRVTHGEPLREMPSLRPGDRVVVETRHRTFDYRIDTDPNNLVVTYNDIWVIDELPRNPDGGVQPGQRPGRRLITLTTCSELFHTDNRMIAFGHLVGSRRR